MMVGEIGAPVLGGEEVARYLHDTAVEFIVDFIMGANGDYNDLKERMAAHLNQEVWLASKELRKKEVMAASLTAILCWINHEDGKQAFSVFINQS